METLFRILQGFVGAMVIVFCALPIMMSGLQGVFAILPLIAAGLAVYWALWLLHRRFVGAKESSKTISPQEPWAIRHLALIISVVLSAAMLALIEGAET